MGQIANISLALLLGTMLVANLSAVLGLLGSGALVALLLNLVVAVASGYLLGGPERGSRSVLALGTGQRNLAVAFVVAAGNFSDQPDVLALLTAAGLIGLILVMPLAAEIGRRAQRAGAVVEAGAALRVGEEAAPPATPSAGYAPVAQTSLAERANTSHQSVDDVGSRASAHATSERGEKQERERQDVRSSALCVRLPREREHKQRR